MVVSTLTRSSPETLSTSTDKGKFDFTSSSPLAHEIHQFDHTSVGPSLPISIPSTKSFPIREDSHMNSNSYTLGSSPERSKIPLLTTVPFSDGEDSDMESPRIDHVAKLSQLKASLDPEITLEIEVIKLSLPERIKLFFLSLRDMTWQSALRITVLAILLCGILTFLGFLIGSNHVQNGMINILGWLSKLPKWAGSLIMIGMYCFGLLLFCPGTPFNLAAGFLFGIWIGTGVAMAGCILGAAFAFLLGRTIARDWIKKRMEERPKFKAVDWAIQKNGIYIVFLTRLSPLFPFPLLNYGFGITKVASWQYLLGTFAGVIPATVAYTYLGTLMRNITDIWTATDTKKSNTNLYWMIGGAVMTVISIVVISVITKRAITKATREYEMQNQLKQSGSMDSMDTPPPVELEEIIES